jgi:hypothetical protein
MGPGPCPGHEQANPPLLNMYEVHEQRPSPTRLRRRPGVARRAAPRGCARPAGISSRFSSPRISAGWPLFFEHPQDGSDLAICPCLRLNILWRVEKSCVRGCVDLISC